MRAVEDSIDVPICYHCLRFRRRDRRSCIDGGGDCVLRSVGSERETPLTTGEKEGPRHDHRNDDGSRHSLTPPLLPLPRLTH